MMAEGGLNARQMGQRLTRTCDAGRRCMDGSGRRGAGLLVLDLLLFLLFTGGALVLHRLAFFLFLALRTLVLNHWLRRLELQECRHSRRRSHRFSPR